MPSPFPGMNPFLEQPDVWHDFHQDFCATCRRILVPQARPNYIIKLEEYVYIHEPSAEEGTLVGIPDVAVSRDKDAGSAGAGVAAIEAPAYARLAPTDYVEHLSYVEILDRMSRKVVTVIELLSPANKRPGPHRESYVAKRRTLLATPVHFVELDLLRGGPRMPMEGLPDCDYYAMVARVEESPLMGIWPIRLRDPLPTIPIPLRAPDRDIRLDLRAVLDRVYDAAGYSDYIYTGAPEPPLSPEDAEWARRVVAEAT